MSFLTGRRKPWNCNSLLHKVFSKCVSVIPMASFSDNSLYIMSSMLGRQQYLKVYLVDHELEFV